MSIEISVISDTRLLSLDGLQRAINTARLPLQLPRHETLHTLGGALTVQLRNKPVELQYRFEPFSHLKELYHDVNFGHNWRYRLALPWIHGFDGVAAAWMVAAGYASATNGMVFDPQEAKLFSPEQALKIAKDLDRSRPEMEAIIEKFKQQLLSDKPK